MIIYGKQVSIYALENHAKSINRVYITKKEVLPPKLFKEFGSKIKFIENRWIQSLTKGGNHQGVAVDMEELELTPLSQLKGGDFVLVLDGLTDVGNIGSIIRTAYCLGVDAVVASGVRQLNIPAIVRSSSGALLDMPFTIKKNTLEVINELKMSNFKLYSASMDGEPVETKKFHKKRALILGSEGRGVSKRVQNRVDEKISIKMRRDFDSLNVSAAAAIIIDRMSYGIE
jgi:23S rRNA (guanosine2251-2'-O)-methyltransferase